MPVTVRPAQHDAEKIKMNVSPKRLPNPGEDERIALERTAIVALPPPHNEQAKEVIQTSWSIDDCRKVLSCNNGLFNTVWTAYSRHHHLVLRPDDIWLVIITQLSTYINSHGEELRDKFVSHEGKRKLVIEFDLPSYKDAPFDKFAMWMTDMLNDNLTDKELQDWILPNFTTTTIHDTICASVAMMAFCQAWFDYAMITRCGLPSVTLQGTKEDWQMVLDRLDKLQSWGPEPAHYCELLKPILRRFVLTFDAPESEEVLDFWNRVISRERAMSGVTLMSGWLTGFFYWDKDGARIFEHSPADATKQSKSQRPVERDNCLVETKTGARLCLDDMVYGWINFNEIPDGHLQVPVEIDNYGTIINSTMVVGLTGMMCSSSSNKSATASKDFDTLSPYSAWWIYKTLETPEPSNPSSVVERHANHWEKEKRKPAKGVDPKPAKGRRLYGKLREMVGRGPPL